MKELFELMKAANRIAKAAENEGEAMKAKVYREDVSTEGAERKPEFPCIAKEATQSPSYYERLAIDPTTYISSNGLGWHEGNIVKYISRYKFKNGLEDLYKAQDYLNKLIAKEEEIKDQMKKRVLIYDIETFPLIVRVFDLWKEGNVLKIVKDFEIASIAYTWFGEPGGIKVIDRAGQKSDCELMKKFHKIMSQADVVMAHNGTSFDNKKTNTRFVKWGLPAITSYENIDTKVKVKQVFGFSSNKLNDIATFLGVGRKMPHTGMDMWFGCEQGDEKSWEMMRRYNKHDVYLLRGIYDILKGSFKNHPNMSVTGNSCPTCDSKKLVSNGWRATKTMRYRRYKCLNCGASSRDVSADKNYRKPLKVGI